MRDTCYLITDANGVVRMTKRAPSLYRNEVAVKLTVSVPDEAFRSFTVSATLDVPEDRIIQPDITVEADQLPQPEPEQ